MGHTKDTIQVRYDILMSKNHEEGKEFFGQLLSVLNDYPDKVWGYEEFGKDGVIVIGADLTKEKREGICKHLTRFKVILFLKGLSQTAYLGDLSLVQRVMMYGGSLPEWKWALGAGEWKESYHEYLNEFEVMQRTGVEYVNPYKRKKISGLF